MYLDRIPDDVYSDDGFRYRRRRDGFLLYSVGRNGKDDGGPLYLVNEEEDEGEYLGVFRDDVGVRVPKRVHQ